MCRDTSHKLLRYFLVFACALYLYLCYTAQICSEMGHFPIFSFLAAIFVTIATVKVDSMPDFYTLAIVLINSYKKTCEEQLLFFDLIGGPK